MKRSIVWKFILLFFSIAVILFFLLRTVGENVITEHTITKKKDLLYEMVNSFSNEYLINYYYTNDSAYSEIIEEITLLNETVLLNNIYGIRLWLVSNRGVIMADSQMVGSLFDIRSANIHFFEAIFQEHVYFPEIMSEPALCVILPVILFYDSSGYLVMSIEESEIQREINEYIEILECMYVLFLIVLVIVLIVVYCFTVLPVKRITKVAKQISVGNFEKEYQLKKLKAYPKLVQSIQYMGVMLKHTDDAQRKFISNVSHDFRSPLTSIKGYIEAIKDGTIPIEMQEKYLDVIIFETERLTKLTTNLLKLNSFEENGIVLYRSEFDINQMIRQIAMSFEGTFKKKKLKLNLVLSQKEQLVYADMDKIQQVLYNLMDNAIKFSNQKSFIQIVTEEKGNKVVIKIKDNGIGIPKDCIDKIWNRFYKVDVSRGMDKKGTGLGLAIVKELITAHGETISVTSTEGVETEFVFSLPRVM